MDLRTKCLAVAAGGVIFGAFMLMRGGGGSTNHDNKDEEEIEFGDIRLFRFKTLEGHVNRQLITIDGKISAMEELSKASHSNSEFRMKTFKSSLECDELLTKLMIDIDGADIGDDDDLRQKRRGCIRRVQAIVDRLQELTNREDPPSEETSPSTTKSSPGVAE